jgi:hypothetical protein
MVQEVNIRIEYCAEKDVLCIIVLPERDVETRAMGYDDDFLMFHEKDNPHVIIGIEILDFTETICRIDQEDIPFPECDVTFTISGSSLRGVSFRDMLTWAYGRFAAKTQFAEAV